MRRSQKRGTLLGMHNDLPSTGETQAIATEDHHGFVDSCIALIENLLHSRELPLLQPQPEEPAGE